MYKGFCAAVLRKLLNTLNKHSINVTRTNFFHNLVKTLAKFRARSLFTGCIDSGKVECETDVKSVEMCMLCLCGSVLHWVAMYDLVIQTQKAVEMRIAVKNADSFHLCRQSESCYILVALNLCCHSDGIWVCFNNLIYNYVYHGTFRLYWPHIWSTINPSSAA